MYTCLMAGVLALYTGSVIVGIVKEKMGDKKLIRKLRHKAPLYTAILLLLTAFDYATIKTNIFTYPLVPCVNNIMYAAYTDYATLLNSALHTLKLMFEGYAIGVILGLITGITCGYSQKVNYWIDPIIKFLGPIPISTWIPIIMVFMSGALDLSALFIIVIGVWTAVTNASRAGVANIDKAYFDAAKILGASEYQLIFRVAIPCAMPNIMAGMTQGMMTACTAIMVAEMMGVKAGLGWYITWDEDFTDEPCCVTVMNKDFIKENPLMAKYICKAIYRAQEYIGNNVEEITQAQIDEGLFTGGLAKLTECMESYQWGKVIDDEFTERALREIVEDYIRIGLLTTMKDADKVMEKVWMPLANYSISK